MSTVPNNLDGLPLLPLRAAAFVSAIQGREAIGQAGRGAAAFADSRVPLSRGIGLGAWDFSQSLLRRLRRGRPLTARSLNLLYALRRRPAYFLSLAASFPAAPSASERTPGQRHSAGSGLPPGRGVGPGAPTLLFVTRTLLARSEYSPRSMSFPVGTSTAAPQPGLARVPLIQERTLPEQIRETMQTLPNFVPLLPPARLFVTAETARPPTTSERFWRERSYAFAEPPLSRPAVPQASWLGVSPSAPPPVERQTVPSPVATEAWGPRTPLLAERPWDLLPPPLFVTLPEMVYGTRAFTPRPLPPEQTPSSFRGDSPAAQTARTVPRGGSATEEEAQRSAVKPAVRLLAVAAALGLAQILPGRQLPLLALSRPAMASPLFVRALPLTELSLVRMSPSVRRMREEEAGPAGVMGMGRVGTAGETVRAGRTARSRSILADDAIMTRLSAAVFPSLRRPLVSTIWNGSAVEMPLPVLMAAQDWTRPAARKLFLPSVVPALFADDASLETPASGGPLPRSRGQEDWTEPPTRPRLPRFWERVLRPMAFVQFLRGEEAAPLKNAELLRRYDAAAFSAPAFSLTQNPALKGQAKRAGSPSGAEENRGLVWPDRLAPSQVLKTVLFAAARPAAFQEVSSAVPGLAARFFPQGRTDGAAISLQDEFASVRPLRPVPASVGARSLPRSFPRGFPLSSPPALPFQTAGEEGRQRPVTSAQPTSEAPFAGPRLSAALPTGFPRGRQAARAAFVSDKTVLSSEAEFSEIVEEAVVGIFQTHLLSLITDFLLETLERMQTVVIRAAMAHPTPEAPVVLRPLSRILSQRLFAPVRPSLKRVLAVPDLSPEPRLLPGLQDAPTASPPRERRGVFASVRSVPALTRGQSLWEPPQSRRYARLFEEDSQGPARPDAMPHPASFPRFVRETTFTLPQAPDQRGSLSLETRLREAFPRHPSATMSLPFSPYPLPRSQAAESRVRGVRSAPGPGQSLPPRPLPMTLPIANVVHPAESGLAVQRVAEGTASAASAPSAQRAQQDTSLASQEKGAMANDVHLLANEVWSLLKRRLETEAERIGRR